MKKFILVLFIGMVLVMNLYGFAKEQMTEKVKNVNHSFETVTIVYEE